MARNILFIPIYNIPLIIKLIKVCIGANELFDAANRQIPQISLHWGNWVIQKSLTEFGTVQPDYNQAWKALLLSKPDVTPFLFATAFKAIMEGRNIDEMRITYQTDRIDEALLGIGSNIAFIGTAWYLTNLYHNYFQLETLKAHKAPPKLNYIDNVGIKALETGKVIPEQALKFTNLTQIDEIEIDKVTLKQALEFDTLDAISDPDHASDVIGNIYD